MNSQGIIVRSSVGHMIRTNCALINPREMSLLSKTYMHMISHRLISLYCIRVLNTDQTGQASTCFVILTVHVQEPVLLLTLSKCDR